MFLLIILAGLELPLQPKLVLTSLSCLNLSSLDSKSTLLGLSLYKDFYKDALAAFLVIRRPQRN